MCGSLNIEHVWISANIPMKRRYVRQNLLAWLKRPSLGLIPLLMAGDKHLFWYTNRLKRETQLETSIFCGTEYEKTNFKAQFLKVANNSASIHQPNSLNFMSKVNMASKYGAEFILNPSYFNSSIPFMAKQSICSGISIPVPARIGLGLQFLVFVLASACCNCVLPLDAFFRMYSLS